MTNSFSHAFFTIIDTSFSNLLNRLENLETILSGALVEPEEKSCGLPVPANRSIDNTSSSSISTSKQHSSTSSEHSNGTITSSSTSGAALSATVSAPTSSAMNEEDIDIISLTSTNANK